MIHTHTHTSCYNSTQFSLLGTENCLPPLHVAYQYNNRCNHLSTQFTNVSHTNSPSTALQPPGWIHILQKMIQYFQWTLLLLFNCRSFNFLFFSGFHFLVSGFLCSFFSRFLLHCSHRDCVLFFIACLLFFRGCLPLLWFFFIPSLQQISNILTPTLSITKSFCVHYTTICR